MADEEISKFNKKSIKNIDKRLNKIKKAKLKAKTNQKRDKLIDSTVEIKEELDTQIRNLSMMNVVKFRRKAKDKKLRGLGEKRNEIVQELKELYSLQNLKDSEMAKLKNKMGEISDAISGKIDSINSGIKNIFFDERFVKAKSATDVLKIVKGLSKEDIGKPKQTKSEKEMDIGKPKQNKSEKEMDKGKDNPLKLAFNSDVYKREDILKNNDKIYDYLIRIGEVDIVKYLMHLMTPREEKDITNVSDIKKNTEAINKLSIVNSKIHSKLSEIEEGMVDEQDTSISLPKKLESAAAAESAPPVKEKSGNFLMDILKKLFGGWLGKLLMGATGLVAFATAILGAGWGFLRDKITKLIKGAVGGVIGTVKGMIALALKPFEYLLKGAGAVAEGAKKLGGKIFSGAKNLLSGPDKVDPNKPMSKNIEEIEKSKKPEKEIKKMPTKGTVLKQVGKFAKVVPFIGTAVAVGSAAYSAMDGFNKADEILDKDADQLTMRDKLAAAAGSLVNDVTFGIISAKTVAEKIADTPDKTEKKIDLVQINELTGVMRDIELLKGQLNDAKSEGDEVKQMRILKNIEKKNKEIEKLQRENNDVEVADKTVISKDGSIQMSEDMYRAAIGNTKKYDTGKYLVNPGKQQNVSINNVMAGSRKEQVNPSDMFIER